MTIEITKKHLLVFAAIAMLVLIIGGGYASYSLGYSSGYEDGNTSGYEKGLSAGVAETEKKYQNPKGDGSAWYAESINNGNDYLYHSTSSCPYIRNGINKNWGFTNAYTRKQHSQFCSKCMDSYLINFCKIYLYDDKSWNGN